MSLETMQGSDGYTHREVLGGAEPWPTFLRPEPAPSITDEARRLVAGERADAYGPAEASFEKIGRLWGALLGIEDIEPRKVALLLEALKVGREFNKASRDNRVDGVGYWLLADRLAAGDD